jgi:hypothetical protein
MSDRWYVLAMPDATLMLGEDDLAISRDATEVTVVSLTVSELSRRPPVERRRLVRSCSSGLRSSCPFGRRVHRRRSYGRRRYRCEHLCHLDVLV